jgi:diguanylate cyclase (GGDEF)-like protein
LRNAEADAQLRYMAYYDPLTRIPNAQALAQIVTAAIAREPSHAHQTVVGLLHLDVIGCSRIRSIFGPDTGDQVLRAFAIRLEGCIAAQDHVSVARVDGDRFVMCLTGYKVRERTIELADQLQREFEQPVFYGSHQFFLAPASGIAFSPEHGTDAVTLLTAAAAAKHYGINNSASTAVVYTNHIGDRARERLTLEAALREAVRTEQLTLTFQPKLRLTDGAMIGVEALLRWFDLDFGHVSPDRFIPLAEESGLILQIGRWVVQAAARQIANWRDAGLNTSIAINFSARQFMHDDPAQFIRAAAAEAAIDPAAIVIEITESSLIQDLSSVRGGLLALRELGCRIAIDDFGTGYSSLAYLRGLPVDELKIDKAFIRSVASDPIDAAICTAILSLARDIGLRVTAEGVETEAQLEWLRDHECAEVQGFLLAEPVPAHEVLSRYGHAAQVRKSGS